jgi:hypothetical protein
VPALVREMVAAGAAVHAVVPTRQSLEDRFMALLGAEAGAETSKDPVAEASDDSEAKS